MSAALPLLFAVGVDGFATIVSPEVVAVEVVRTLVGLIGLVTAVPMTPALAAVALGARNAGSATAPALG